MNGLALVNSMFQPPVLVGLVSHERFERANNCIMAQIQFLDNGMQVCLARVQWSSSSERQNNDFLFLRLGLSAMLPVHVKPAALFRDDKMPLAHETFTLN